MRAPIKPASCPSGALSSVARLEKVMTTSARIRFATGDLSWKAGRVPVSRHSRSASSPSRRFPLPNASLNSSFTLRSAEWSHMHHYSCSRAHALSQRMKGPHEWSLRKQSPPLQHRIPPAYQRALPPSPLQARHADTPRSPAEVSCRQGIQSMQGTLESGSVSLGEKGGWRKI